jgi:hypothetical protein
MSSKPGKQTIIRAPHDRKNPYFMMARQAAQNDGLSYEARGLLAYLLSKPVDWKINVADIENEHCGRDKARNIIKELVKCGYMTAPVRVQNKLGQWSWTPYHLYEAPPEPKTEKPNSANQTTAEPNSENTSSYSSTEEESTETENTSSAVAESSTTASQSITRQQWDALLIEIGNVFKASGIEAINYANMLTGKARKGAFGKCAITPPVLADELRAWAVSYRAANPGVALVKQPPKLYSAIVEYRKQHTPAPASANGNGKRKAYYYQNAWVEASRLSPDGALDGTLRPGWMLAEISAAGDFGGMALRAGEKVYHDGTLPLAWQGLE